MKTLRSLLVASLLCPLGSLMLSGCAIDAGVDEDDVGVSEVAPELDVNADPIVIGPIFLSQIAYTTSGDIHSVKSDGSVVNNGGSNPTSGYSLIEAKTLEDAIAKAKRCPILGHGGSIELAPTLDM